MAVSSHLAQNLDQGLDDIHVRSAVQHGHGYHLDSQVLADGEMPIVAR